MPSPRYASANFGLSCVAFVKCRTASGEILTLPRQFAQHIFGAGIRRIDRQLLLATLSWLRPGSRARDSAWKAAAAPGGSECPDSADFRQESFDSPFPPRPICPAPRSPLHPSRAQELTSAQSVRAPAPHCWIDRSRRAPSRTAPRDREENAGSARAADPAAESSLLQQRGAANAIKADSLLQFFVGDVRVQFWSAMAAPRRSGHSLQAPRRARLRLRCSVLALP